MAKKGRREKMRDWHRIFVQKLMSAGVMSGVEVFVFVRCLIEQFTGKPGFPVIDLEQDQGEVKGDIASLIEDLLNTSNEALEEINFQIKKGQQENKEDEKYEQCYVFCPIEENEQIAKLQKVFGEPELEFLRLICSYLVEEKVATENKLINLSVDGGFNSTKKKLTLVEASNAVQKFLDLGYLVYFKKHNRASSKGGTYSLGARLLLELETWLKTNLEVDLCSICGKPVVQSVECSTKGCNNFFHKYCVEKKCKCTECKQPLKIEGVASKR